MTVEVAEVARVDAPRPLARALGHDRAGGLGLREQRVDRLTTFDEVPEAELAALRVTARNARILRELAARVQRERHSALELEHRDRARGVDAIPGELRAGDPARVETEPVAVEPKRPLEIVDGERDHIDARFHGCTEYCSGIRRRTCVRITLGPLQVDL